MSDKKYQQLEIDRFDPEGGLVRRVRCLAGRITVFRSRAEEDLRAYQGALLSPSPEELGFRVLVDGEPLAALRDVTWIGFGEEFRRNDNRSVYEYLLFQSVPAPVLTQLL